MSFDALLKAIPDYIDQLLRLISAPKRFFAGLDLDGKDGLVRAIVFITISAVLAYVLRVPFLDAANESYWSQAILVAIVSIISVVIFGILAFFCARMLGGRASLRGHVVMYAYIAGVSGVIFAIASLISKGIILTQLGETVFPLYLEYMELLFSGSEKIDDACYCCLAQSDEMLLSMLVLFAGFLLLAVWFVVAWRAVGERNHLSRRRTHFALVVFLVVGFPATYAMSQAHRAANVTVFKAASTAQTICSKFEWKLDCHPKCN